MAVRTVSSGCTWTNGGSRSPFAGQHRFGGCSLGPQEPVVGHPTVVVELGEVPPARVGDEDHDHVVGAERLADLERGPHRGAGRPPDQDPLFPGDPAGRQEGVAIGDGDHPVDDPEGRRCVGQKSSPMPSTR